MLSWAEKPLRDLSENDVVEFSRARGEPSWVTRLRIRALEFLKTTSPDPFLDGLMEEIALKTVLEGFESPSMSVEEALRAARKLGVSEEEARYVSGLALNVDNRVVEAVLKYTSSRGVVLESMDEAVKKYDAVKEYAFKLIGPTTSRKAAYHTLLWSGGPFLYVPRGVRIPLPLYSVFLIGREGLSQTEHSLLVVDEGASVDWVEGCTIPLPLGFGVHLGALELHALRGSKARVISINNWLGGVHHAPIKKAVAHDASYVELTSVGFWAKTVDVAPTVELLGRGSAGVVQNIGFYRGDQRVVAKPRIVMAAPRTRGRIANRTVVADEAREEFYGRLRVERGAVGASGYMTCNTLLLGDRAESVADPSLDTSEKNSELSHEASVGRLDKEKLYYLALSGLGEEEAVQVLVTGFFEPVLSRLPMDIRVEVKRTVELAMKGR